MYGQSSRSAKILYRPWVLIASMVCGLVAGKISRQSWKHLMPGDQDDPPQPLQSEYCLEQILIAAIVQGAIFAGGSSHAATVGSPDLPKRWTGEWPSD